MLWFIHEILYPDFSRHKDERTKKTLAIPARYGVSFLVFALCPYLVTLVLRYEPRYRKQPGVLFYLTAIPSSP